MAFEEVYGGFSGNSIEHIDYVQEKLGKGQWEVGRKRVADVVFEHEMAQMDDGIDTTMDAKAKLTSWKQMGSKVI